MNQEKYLIKKKNGWKLTPIYGQDGLSVTCNKHYLIKLYGHGHFKTIFIPLSWRCISKRV